MKNPYDVIADSIGKVWHCKHCRGKHFNVYGALYWLYCNAGSEWDLGRWGVWHSPLYWTCHKQSDMDWLTPTGLIAADWFDFRLHWNDRSCELPVCLGIRALY